MLAREPVLVGQIVAVIGVAGLFGDPVRSALEAVGGEIGLMTAVGTVVTFVTTIVRSRVTPME